MKTNKPPKNNSVSNSVRYLLKEGIRNIWSNRTMSFASIGVLISCLLLTGAAVLLSMNISSAMKAVEGNNSVRVLCEQELPTLKAVQVRNEIQKLDNIDEVEMVLQDEAIQQMMDSLGDDGTLLESLKDENFLPTAFKVTLKDLSKYKETEEQIQQIEGVYKINNYQDVANKLLKLDNLVHTAGFWIVLILSLVSLFIISNTIRVTMFSRRLEISIMKSVGATNWFVRIPFIVEGVIIGLLSGAVASVLLSLVYQQLVNVLGSVTAMFAPLEFGPMVGAVTLLFMGAGALFGMAGGIISIGKYLRKEGGDSVVW